MKRFDGFQLDVGKRRKNCRGFGPLQRQQTVGAAQVFHRAGKAIFAGDGAHPGKIIVAAGGVDAEQIAIGAQFVDGHVVHNASFRIADQRVLHLAWHKR